MEIDMKIVRIALISLLSVISSKEAFSYKKIELGNWKNESSYVNFLSRDPSYRDALSLELKFNEQKTEKLIKSKYGLVRDALNENDLQSASSLLKEITTLRNSNLVSKSSSTLISESLFLLASIDKANSLTWIKEAYNFNPDYPIDPKKISPPLVSQFSSLETATNRSKIKADTLSYPKTLKIFINGKPLKSQDTYFSHSLYPVQIYGYGLRARKLKLKGSDLINLKSVRLNPKNLGTCEAPNIKSPGLFVFYSDNCIRTKNFNEHNVEKSPQTSLLARSTQKRPLFKRKSTWIAIGASVIATSVALSINNSRKRSSDIQPVHRVLPSQ